MITCVICDCDGTILDDKKNIDSNLLETINRLRKNGIIFTLASGRNVHLMLDIVDYLNVDVPYISDNGANIFQGKKEIVGHVMNHETTKPIFQILKDNKVPFLAYSKNKLFTYDSSEYLGVFTKSIKGKIEMFDIDQYENEEIYKITLDSTNINNINELQDSINNTYKEVSFKQSESALYTIVDFKASKGNTVIELAKLLNIKPEEIMVFGDNYNDVSMFEVAGVSVSMENSIDEIKQKTTFVAKSNNENGVSEFLNNYFKL